MSLVGRLGGRELCLLLDEASVRAVLPRAQREGVRVQAWESPQFGLILAVVVPLYSGDFDELDAHIRRLVPNLCLPIAYSRKPPLTEKSSDCFISGKFEEATEEERVVAALMSEALGRRSIERDSSFIEQGGHSLGLTKIKAALERRFEVRLKYGQVFRLCTPRLLAVLIRLAEPVPRTEEKEGTLGQTTTLSQAERRLYFAARRHHSSTAYNVPVLLDVGKSCCSKDIRKALTEVLVRHENLFSRFFERDGRVYRRACQPQPIALPLISLREDEVLQAISSFTEPFELDRGPLVRGMLVRTENRTLICLDFHHLVVDGTSVQLLTEELNQVLLGAELRPRGGLAVGSETSDSGCASQAVAFWNDLPFHKVFLARTIRPTGDGLVRRAVSADLIREVSALCRAEGTTLHCFFLALTHVLVSRLSGGGEVTIGVPSDGRALSHHSAVGAFVLTLPSSHTLFPDLKFPTFLAEVTEQHLLRTEHQLFAPDFSSEYEVVFSSQRFHASLERVRWLPHFNLKAHFPLLIYLVESEGAFEVVVEYDGNQIDRHLGTAVAECLIQMATSVIGSPQQPLSAISLRSAEAELELKKRLEFPVHEKISCCSVVERWRATVSMFPERVALRDRSQSFTYQELDAWTDRLARTLVARGVSLGDRVALLTERHVRYVVCQLAILKAGAQYVPVDPDYPDARVRQMLEMADCRLCLRLDGPQGLTTENEVSWEELETEGAGALELPEPSLEDGAYVMFTSGSTGKPKGVSVSHGNILRLVLPDNVVPLDQETRVLLTGSPSFDATTYEVWGPLLQGGCLTVVPKTDLLDTHTLGDLIKEHHINVMWLTAPLFSRLVHLDERIFSGLLYLIVGGDVVSPDAANRLYQSTPEVVLINGYGPTENTTFSTFHVVPRKSTGAIPIGRALANSSAYVMDESRQLLPAFGVGELYVGGAGVALGYVGDPETSAEKFLNHQWPSGRVERLYRTGDLAYYDHEATVHFVGRRDSQVKVRGYRVEIAEVVEALLEVGNVEQAYVRLVDCDGEQQLAAYLVPSGELELRELQEELFSKLPRHMVPHLVAVLDELPLNINGKVDVKNLPPVRVWGSAGQGEAPSDPLEVALADLWLEVLPVGELSRHEDFFFCGGNSILAMRLSSRIAESFSVPFTVSHVFEAPTIARQASLLCELEGSESEQTTLESEIRMLEPGDGLQKSS